MPEGQRVNLFENRLQTDDMLQVSIGCVLCVSGESAAAIDDVVCVDECAGFLEEHRQAGRQIITSHDGPLLLLTPGPARPDVPGALRADLEPGDL